MSADWEEGSADFAEGSADLEEGSADLGEESADLEKGPALDLNYNSGTALEEREKSLDLTLKKLWNLMSHPRVSKRPKLGPPISTKSLVPL